VFLYKLLLTLNATSWMAIIYAIKEGWTIGKIPSHFFGIMLLIIPVFLSWLSLALSRFLGTESPVLNCKEFNLADGEFLPIYLGYFFVSVGVSEHFTMLVVYLIVFLHFYHRHNTIIRFICFLATIITMFPPKAEQRFLLSEKDLSSATLKI
jgi:hypothetical protein